MVKIDLITGFLGAGKTSFLLGYAKYLMRQGERLGILEYDYGAVNVDVLMLGELRGEQCELEMLAAACDADCLKRRLRTKLISMAMSGYDRVLVEPSGIFDVDDFFDTLHESPLDRWYDTGNVITVVNARLNAGLNREERFLLASQTSHAGIILLSRVQCASESEISGTLSLLERASKEFSLRRDYAASLISKPWDCFSDEDYLRISSSGYELHDYVKATAGQEDMLFSSLYYLNKNFTLEMLKEKANLLFNNNEYGFVYRIKGCVCSPEGWVLYNAARTEQTVTRVANGKNTLIIIGKQLADDKINALMSE